MTDLAHLDATGQAELVHRGELRPVDLVDAAIERIQKLNGELNAVIHERFEKARAEAEELADRRDERLFRGVPFVHKDLDGVTQGDPYHAGSRFLKEAGYVADHDSYLAAEMKAAGFVLVGKTNTPEEGYMPTTEPLAYGPTHNPWDTTRSPGGSSGGSAAAVASGMVPVGHAGDGGGSIRIPASSCGLVGLKPTRGRVSLGPDDGDVWDGFVVRGVVTRSVRDTAAILDVISGPMPGDPHVAPGAAEPYADEVGTDPGRLRIGVCAVIPNGSTELDSDCVAAAEETAMLLEDLGHDVDAAYPAALAEEVLTTGFGTMYSVFAVNDVDDLSEKVGRPATEADIEPMTWALTEIGRSVTGAQYLAAKRSLQQWSRRMAAWWDEEGFDLLLTPTVAEPPPALGQFHDPSNPLTGLFRSAALVPFTVPFNVTGQPAISLPLHWTADGLPVGIQLAAAFGREDLLIRIASQLEHARPWADRRPAVHA